MIPAHCFTVVGGRHATEAPEAWLHDCPNIDVLVRGDGDETIEEIAERYLTSVETLIQNNCLSSNMLLPGHIIFVPSNGTPP